MNTDIVSQAVVKLFETKRFYAEVLLQMDRLFNKSVPIAGVCIKDKIQLHINLEAFEKLSPKERVAVLEHECGHILRDHIYRSKELAPDVYKKTKDDVQSNINSWKHKMLNVAADLAINCHVRNLPENSYFPKAFELPDGETMEWYLENIKNNNKFKDINEFDDHAIWAESDEASDMLKEKVRQAINNAALKTRAAGRLTGEDELLVSRFNHKPKDWKADLRRFAARTIEDIREETRKKRNRRYGLMFPGVKKIERLHIGIAIDTSGSVSDDALCQFMAEIHHMSKYAEITVVEADAEVKKAYKYDPKKTYTISGRGGTAYQPAFDYFNKIKDIDGVIYFGDGDCSDSEDIKKPQYPVLWALIGNQDRPADFGYVTRIEINNAKV